GKSFCRVVGRLHQVFGILLQVPNLLCRDAAVEENAAVVLSVDLLHVGGVCACNHQHKTRWTVKAIILRRQYLDWHLGNCQFLERLLIEFHHPCHVGGLDCHFVFVVCAEF